MKKVFLFLCAALFTLSANAQYYETEAEAGDFALGINLNAGTNDPLANFGLGGKLQFYASHAFRIEASFNGFIKRDDVKYWDTNLNAHYVFYLKEGFSFYPILGATINHGYYTKHGFGFGLNAGAGLQYDITENLYTTAEAYYKYCSKASLDKYNDKYSIGPRVNISVGVAYRF